MEQLRRLAINDARFGELGGADIVDDEPAPSGLLMVD